MNTNLVQEQRLITKNLAISAYRILSSAKMGKMGGEGKTALLVAMFALKKEAEDFEAFRKSTFETLMAEFPNADRLKELQGKGELTEEEKAESQKLEGELGALLTPAIVKKVEEESEAKFEHLTDSQFAELLDSNDWSVELAMMLKEAIA